MCDGKFDPIMTDSPAAPKSLLHIVRCYRATDCGSSRCTRRKHNMLCSDCSPACGNCRDSACTNVILAAENGHSSDDDNEYNQG